VPLDACHILLGRPWLFDRRVTHDGHLNTYTFTKDTQENHPYPSQAYLSKKSPRHSIMDIFFTNLLHSQLHELDDFKDWILLGQELAEVKDFSHPLLVPFLKAFQHVFLSEVLHNMPLKDPYNTKMTSLSVPHSQTSRSTT